MLYNRKRKEQNALFQIKPNTQVWFIGRISAFQAEEVGSIPTTCPENYIRTEEMKCHYRMNLELG